MLSAAAAAAMIKDGAIKVNERLGVSTPGSCPTALVPIRACRIIQQSCRAPMGSQGGSKKLSPVSWVCQN